MDLPSGDGISFHLSPSPAKALWIPEELPHQVGMAGIVLGVRAADLRTPQLDVVGYTKQGKFVELAGRQGRSCVADDDGVERPDRSGYRLQQVAATRSMPQRRQRDAGRVEEGQRDLPVDRFDQTGSEAQLPSAFLYRLRAPCSRREVWAAGWLHPAARVTRPVQSGRGCSVRCRWRKSKIIEVRTATSCSRCSGVMATRSGRVTGR